MKPKLGRVVYVVYKETISKFRVGYVGKSSFIIDDFCEDMNFEILEWRYDDFDKTWFTSFNKAKNALLNNVKNTYINAKICKVYEDYWAVKI